MYSLLVTSVTHVQQRSRAWMVPKGYLAPRKYKKRRNQGERRIYGRMHCSDAFIADNNRAILELVDN
jgi:hypothetical protein